MNSNFSQSYASSQTKTGVDVEKQVEEQMQKYEHDIRNHISVSKLTVDRATTENIH